MPPKPIIPLESIDLENILYDREAIRTINPHRHEMEQIDAICLMDPDQVVVAGFRDVRDDEFWVRGHIPGRPLLPGVLMAEAAAQACTYYYKRCTDDDRFLGFGGIDKWKFRGTVVPGDRLIIIAKNIELKSRRAVFQTQGVVDGRVVFEGIITGMPV